MERRAPDWPLQSETPPSWLAAALSRFDEVLVDHAHCEKKAAASAMALVNAYPEHDVLVRRLARLAQEELRHFQAVHRHLVARGLSLGADHGDPYAQALLKLCRHGKQERLTDRLLVSALIEARSCERLELLASSLNERELRSFYAGLATSEAGHYRLFVDLARRYDDAGAVAARLTELATLEAGIVAALPVLPRIH